MFTTMMMMMLMMLICRTEIKLVDGRSSRVRNVATDGVEYLEFDLRDAITVENSNGVVVRVATSTVCSVHHV